MATKRREKHTKELVCNKDVIFYAVYVGSIPVDRSMRTLPYEVRTAVTKEAIVKVCTAAKCLKQEIKRPKGIKQINKILTQSPEINRIGVNFIVSLAGLKAVRSDTGKILMNHSMSSISFASCGDTPFKSFVGYVAKDPVVGRACHVFNCFGDAYDVVSTVGEAFSIKYEDVLAKHSQCNTGNFEFIEVNTGFFQSIFEESENTAQNNQVALAANNNKITVSKSEQNLPLLYENLPRKAVVSTPKLSIPPPPKLSSSAAALLPRRVENSIFYIPRPEETSAWPRTNYCPSPPSSPSPIGGRRKAQSQVMETEQADTPHSPDSNLSPCLTSPPNLTPPGAESPKNTPPIKPPRPKVPIYANIDDVDRQTQGAASNSGDPTSSNAEEGVKATPEELRKNLEALECSLDEISSEKCPQKQQINPYSKMSWFHGKICREEAERRLKYQGDYLVRSHGNGQFVLSCMDSGHVRHLLLVDPHGQIRTRDRKFVSITDLVTHYATSGECIVSEGCALRIIRPVPQPS